jgi:hypothetical protein
MKPQTFLFPGTVKHCRADVPISSNTIWFACRQATKAAGITKHLSPQEMRVDEGGTAPVKPEWFAGRRQLLGDAKRNYGEGAHASVR